VFFGVSIYYSDDGKLIDFESFNL